jgi:hypothetical protein
VCQVVAPATGRFHIRTDPSRDKALPYLNKYNYEITWLPYRNWARDSMPNFCSQCIKIYDRSCRLKDCPYRPASTTALTAPELARIASQMALHASKWAVHCLETDTDRAMSQDVVDQFTDRMTRLLAALNGR